MKLAPVALLLTLTATALAQAPAPFQPLKLSAPFTDPANLRGERPTPLTGHELPIDQSEAESEAHGHQGLAQLLRKLSTRASLMLIVAHPDDEDGGMLTLYSRGLGARVADLSLNRGEGGQNAMTGDFEDALGLIRTQELLSADRYFDASQMFGTEVDFGFSKTKQEAFSKWGHQRVLYDVVRAIRLYRPLVIASVFIGGVTDGHGQHQVAGEIAQEAFLAAADPTVFPELTAEGILPWAPLKVYARVPRQAVTNQGLFDYATGQYTPARFTNYVTGAITTTIPSTDVVIHEGFTDPLLTTCAANPSDLPANLRSATSSPSSLHKPEEPALLLSSFRNAAAPPLLLSSFRNAGGSASPATTDCHPLSYVQFARIGLGLQRSQIGPGTRLPPPGAFDIAYHLYGSRLCNAPLSARPSSTTANTASASPTNASPQNCHPERSEGPASPHAAPLQSAPAPPPAVILSEAKDPRISSAAALPSALTTNPTFFTGIDTSLTGIADLAPHAPAALRLNLAAIERSVERTTRSFNPTRPSDSAIDLMNLLHEIDMVMQATTSLSMNNLEKANVLHELKIKHVQANDALILALGLRMDATTTHSDEITGSDIKVATQLIQQSDVTLPDVSESLMDSALRSSSDNHSFNTEGIVTKQQPFAQDLEAKNLTTTVTKPYFFRDSIEQPVYNLSSPQLRLAPQTPPALTAWADLTLGVATIRIGRIVHSGSQPISIVPPISVALQPHAQVVPFSQRTFSVFMTVTPPDAAAATSLDGPRAWRTDSVKTTGDTDKFTLDLPLGERNPLTLTGSALMQNGQKFTAGFRPVGYPGLITTNYFTPATDRIVPIDLNLSPADHRRIAYLPGTGDAVPEALASIGLTPTILTVADLTPANLAKYDTVILGVRAYNAHPGLHGTPTQALLEFARNGGNVVVQYQTAEFTAADAPYPLTLGRAAEKVVDETAPVKLLQPDNPLLTTPNRITSADFNNWIEERGHGFLESWDPRYTALTETHDPGGTETAPQAPQLGGLITTTFGSDPAHRGHWTYCAFALYRQLPEAVPGAFRLFVNLLTP